MKIRSLMIADGVLHHVAQFKSKALNIEGAQS
jgi:hypothetical protein